MRVRRPFSRQPFSSAAAAQVPGPGPLAPAMLAVALAGAARRRPGDAR